MTSQLSPFGLVAIIKLPLNFSLPKSKKPLGEDKWANKIGLRFFWEVKKSPWQLNLMRFVPLKVFLLCLG